MVPLTPAEGEFERRPPAQVFPSRALGLEPRRSQRGLRDLSGPGEHRKEERHDAGPDLGGGGVRGTEQSRGIPRAGGERGVAAERAEHVELRDPVVDRCRRRVRPPTVTACPSGGRPGAPGVMARDEEHLVKAIRYDRYGPSGVLRLDEASVPEIGDEDVLVRVRAASVNPYDGHFR
jgi:hypothetical protein